MERVWYLRDSESCEVLPLRSLAAAGPFLSPNHKISRNPTKRSEVCNIEASRNQCLLPVYSHTKTSICLVIYNWRVKSTYFKLSRYMVCLVLLSHIHRLQSSVIVKINRSRDFDGFTYFQPPSEYERVVFGILSVCRVCIYYLPLLAPHHNMYVRKHALLALECLGIFYPWSVFKISSIISWSSANGTL
jgi:hypothetical protein